jgi:GAF domain-containing protein
MADESPDRERVRRVAGELAAQDGDPARSLCSVSASVMGVAGAGLTLMSRAQELGSVCMADPMTEAVEEIQYTLGEGPCVDAFHAREAVLVPDLANPALTRWPAFREGALGAGARAAFGFPLRIGAVCIGALNLYHDRTGELTADQSADARALAHVATRAVLDWQSTTAGPLPWQLEQVPVHRAIVHHAAGMVSVQTGLSVDDALALVRAYAFAEGRPLGDVAADVTSRRLRFDA